MKSFKIETPPYGTKLLCIFGDAKEAKKILLKEIGKKKLSRWDFKGCDGLTMMYGGLVILWMRKKPKNLRMKNTLAHEMTHVILFISQYVGLTRDNNAEEGQAYLTGWITEQIYKRVD